VLRAGGGRKGKRSSDTTSHRRGRTDNGRVHRAGERGGQCPACLQGKELPAFEKKKGIAKEGRKGGVIESTRSFCSISGGGGFRIGRLKRVIKGYQKKGQMWPRKGSKGEREICQPTSRKRRGMRNQEKSPNKAGKRGGIRSSTVERKS